MEEYKNLLERLTCLYVYSLKAFSLWDKIQKMNASNHVGEVRAKKNNKIFSRYPHFFGTIQQSTKIDFLVQISKLFDDSEQSIHLRKILNIRINQLSSAFGSKKENQFLKKIRELEKEILDNDDLIKKYKSFRDQYLAHTQRNPDDINIVIWEVETLLSLSERILNTLTKEAFGHEILYSDFQSKHERDVDSVISKLR